MHSSRNGILWDQDVIYDYKLDGTLGRETIGEDSVQGRDYTYTLLGQIKGINHPSLDGSKDPGQDGHTSSAHEHVAPDAFGMAFSYHEDDFDRTYNATASPFNDADASLIGVPNDLAPKDLYSGLIGGWSYKTLATGDANMLRDGVLVGERFLHDKLGRLRADTTYLYNSDWVSDGDGGWGARFQLDPNSNMLRMERWSMTDATTSVKHDDATLALVSNESNALATIDDQGAGVAGYDQELEDATTGDIDVDAKGRITQAEMGTITDATSYTSYDVPDALTRGTSDVTYVRNAFGEIVRADVSVSSTWDHSTYIIPGSVVADQAVYLLDDAEGTPEIQEWSIVGLSRIGVHRGTGSTVTGSITHRNIGHTRYELTDHLGSVRAIVSDIKLDGSGSPAADLLSVADYDPYGATRSMRTLGLSSEAPYRHAFQGMRLLEGAGGLGEYRTPFRLYDGRTGRWAGLDPVQQPWTSPYEGLGSLPTYWTDAWGLEITTQDPPAVQPVQAPLNNVPAPQTTSASSTTLSHFTQSNGFSVVAGYGTATAPSFNKLLDFGSSDVWHPPLLMWQGVPYLSPSTADPARTDGGKLETDVDGVVKNQRVVVQRQPAMETRRFRLQPVAIVLHRTAGRSVAGAINAMVKRGLGVHFIVDTDGTITQLAGLSYSPSHVGGPLKYREAPSSSQSIGIEVVGWYNPKEKKWDDVEQAQAEATAWLVNSLMLTFGLDTDDIYNHEDLKSKTAGEGAVVRKAIDPYLKPSVGAGK